MEIEFNWFLRINRKSAKVEEVPGAEFVNVVESSGNHERQADVGFVPNEEWYEDRRR